MVAETMFRRPPGRPRKDYAPDNRPFTPDREMALPKVADQPISRFTLMDMPEWGTWLVGRLNRQWPGKNTAFWNGKINNISNSNDFLFVKNEEAVLLVAGVPHLMDDRPRAMEVFAWSKWAEPLNEDFPDRLILKKGSRGIHHLAALYLYAADWSRKRGAPWMITGVCTDMPVESLQSLLKGDCADWVVVK